MCKLLPLPKETVIRELDAGLPKWREKFKRDGSHKGVRDYDPASERGYYWCAGLVHETYNKLGYHVQKVPRSEWHIQRTNRSQRFLVTGFLSSNLGG